MTISTFPQGRWASAETALGIRSRLGGGEGLIGITGV